MLGIEHGVVVAAMIVTTVVVVYPDSIFMPWANPFPLPGTEREIASTSLSHGSVQ